MTQYLNAFPFAPPAFILGGLIAFFVSRPLARRLNERRIVLVCWLVSLVFILALTLTPSSYALSMDSSLPMSRIWVWSFPNMSALFSVNWESMNLLMFVPIGVASGLFAGRRNIVVFAMGACATSVLVELIQYAVLPLARPQFNSATVIIGWIGIVVGLAACLFVQWLLNKSAIIRAESASD